MLQSEAEINIFIKKIPEIFSWCKKQSDEEREHAQTFMKYQNLRGGRVVLQPVQNPDKNDWNSTLEAFKVGDFFAKNQFVG